MINDKLGCVFPGQGSQKIGMLAELASEFPLVLDTFNEASSVLGYDLWDLVQNDNNNDLSKTHITQPSILTSSVAIWRVWQSLGGPQPVLMAGHSLGEYSALVCSGVIDFKAGVDLVRKRGEFMQSAVPEGVGGMAAIVGLDDAVVMEACAKAAEDQVVEAVNFNSPGQVVIAGHAEAVERAIALCKLAGAKRALPLPVSAPFHCRLMQPAAERFKTVLDGVTLKSPSIPVLQNFGLRAESDVETIRANLVSQIHSPVPWVETIKLFAAKGVENMLEVGPGKVLCGLVKRIEENLTVNAINDPESLRQALTGIGSSS